MTFNTEIFSQFDKKWALLTAGELGNFNSMTVSWGGLGTIWNKSVATVYVRLSRYTHEFMDNNDYFTVSFYPEAQRKTLGVLGSKSGRDMDKINGSGLTPVKAGKSVSFKEAEITLVCRKLFCLQGSRDYSCMQKAVLPESGAFQYPRRDCQSLLWFRRSA